MSSKPHRTWQHASYQFVSIDLFGYRRLHRIHRLSYSQKCQLHICTLLWHKVNGQHVDKSFELFHQDWKIFHCICSMFSNTNCVVCCIHQSSRCHRLKLQLILNREEPHIPLIRFSFQILSLIL